ncbi:MAG: DUF4113 domain-containing protein [Cognaticolwellia sp.]
MDGVNFYRCSVRAVELESKQFQQHDFLLNKDDPELMRCYDGINNRYGNGTLQLTAEGQVETWQMHENFCHQALRVNGVMDLKLFVKI